MTRVALLPALAFVLLTTGCGGGGAHTSALTPPVGSQPAKGAQGTAHFSLTVPSASAPAARVRRPAFVSPSTLSGTLQVNGGAVIELDLSAASPNCQSVSGGRACLISAPAPSGSDTFTLVLYSGPFTGGVHTGTALSAASNFAATIVEGTSNVTLPLILGGIPVAADVTASGLVARTPSTVPLIITTYDNSGNVIVGPGTFADASGNAASLTVTPAIATAQVTLHDGAQSAASITVAGPSDTVTLQLNAPADIIGIPISVTNAAGTPLPPKTASQIVTIGGGTLHGATKSTISQMPDYTFFAPMDTTLAGSIANGFAFDYGSESNGGIMGYFDDATETLYSCTVPGTQANAAITPVDGGLAIAWSGGLYTDTYPWGLEYLTLATIRAGGTCPSGVAANSYETDNLGTADSVGRSLVYDKTAHRIFEGGDGAAGPGGTVNPSLRYYGFSAPTTSGGTVVFTPYGSYPDALVTANGRRYYEGGGNVIYTQSGVAGPSTSATLAGAAITSLAIGYDQRVYALDRNNLFVYQWDGSSSPVRYNAGRFAAAPVAQPWHLAVGPDGSVFSDNGNNVAQQIQTSGASQSLTLQTTFTPAIVEALFDGHNGYVYAVLSDESNGNLYVDRISY